MPSPPFRWIFPLVAFSLRLDCVAEDTFSRIHRKATCTSFFANRKSSSCVALLMGLAQPSESSQQIAINLAQPSVLGSPDNGRVVMRALCNMTCEVAAPCESCHPLGATSCPLPSANVAILVHGVLHRRPSITKCNHKVGAIK